MLSIQPVIAEFYSNTGDEVVVDGFHLCGSNLYLLLDMMSFHVSVWTGLSVCLSEQRRLPIVVIQSYHWAFCFPVFEAGGV